MESSHDITTLSGARTEAAVRFQRPELPSPNEIERYLELAREARWFSNDGPCSGLFAKRLALRVGEDLHAVVVANATLGLIVALRALTESSPTEAKQVLMPSFTYIATLSAVVYAGFEPVFVDVEPGHWHASPAALATAVENQGTAVACLLPCSTFGTAPPREIRERWEELGRQAGLPVLVDSAAGFGSVDQHGADLGAQGDAEVFSFHATKPLAIGEGGVVMTEDESLAKRMRQLTRFGLAEDHSLPGAPGLNAKMSEAHAAIGLAALDRHDDVLDARRSHFATLRAGLAGQVDFQHDAERSTCQFVSALAPDAASRAAILARAAELRVEVRTYHAPLHLIASLAEYEVSGAVDVTEELASRIVSLPMANDLDQGELERISRCVTEAGA